MHYALRQVLELHGHRPEFALIASKAIFHLCDGNDHNRWVRVR